MIVRPLLCVVVVVLLVRSAAVAGDAQPAGGAVPLPAPEPGTLRVVQMNIWQEGTSVPGGFDKIVDVIIASGAHVVAMSEVRNYHGADLHERLIAALQAKGHTFHGSFLPSDVGLLSRYSVESVESVDNRIRSDSGSIIGYRIQMPGGVPLFVCSAHLDYHHYGLYAPRGYDPASFKLIDNDGDGKPDVQTDPQRVLEADRKSQRRASIAAFLEYVNTHGLAQAPVILAGDFNEGSHLDWTEVTRDFFDHHGLVVPWDNSRTLAEAGFTDAWRELFPDPVTHPGMTWPSVVSSGRKTTWTPLADERDRVDFIYYNKLVLRASRAWVLGPVEYWVRGERRKSENRDPFALAEMPWPSDHKGVLVDFEVRADAAPSRTGTEP